MENGKVSITKRGLNRSTFNVQHSMFSDSEVPGSVQSYIRIIYSSYLIIEYTDYITSGVSLQAPSHLGP